MASNDSFFAMMKEKKGKKSGKKKDSNKENDEYEFDNDDGEDRESDE